MTGSYDLDRMGIIMADIERYLRDFRELKIERVGDLQDKKTFYAASMILFSLLNRVIDLGNEVVMAKSLGIPATYREIFTLLKNEGMIDAETEKKVLPPDRYRNLLSHEYHGIQPADILAVVNLPGVPQAFVATVKAAVKRDTGNP